MGFEGTVLVAGATGRTGKHVIESLRKQGIPARAFARSADKAKDIEGPGVEVVLGTLDDTAAIEKAVDGVKAIIIAIGAGPQRRQKDDGSMEFFYGDGQTPELIDYQGQRNLVEAGKQAGVEHVVQVSTLSVTNSDHFLNKMGGGRSLDWKLKAEDELRESGLRYTIVRPGGLENAKPEQQQLVVDTGDKITGQVKRIDVAEVCVQALLHPEAANKTFELVAEEGPATTDFKSLFASV